MMEYNLCCEKVQVAGEHVVDAGGLRQLILKILTGSQYRQRLKVPTMLISYINFVKLLYAKVSICCQSFKK